MLFSGEQLLEFALDFATQHCIDIALVERIFRGHYHLVDQIIAGRFDNGEFTGDVLHDLINGPAKFLARDILQHFVPDRSLHRSTRSPSLSSQNSGVRTRALIALLRRVQTGRSESRRVPPLIHLLPAHHQWSTELASSRRSTMLRPRRFRQAGDSPSGSPEGG